MISLPVPDEDRGFRRCDHVHLLQDLGERGALADDTLVRQCDIDLFAQIDILVFELAAAALALVQRRLGVCPLRSQAGRPEPDGQLVHGGSQQSRIELGRKIGPLRPRGDDSLLLDTQRHHRGVQRAAV